MLMVNAPLGRTSTEVWFGSGQRLYGLYEHCTSTYADAMRDDSWLLGERGTCSSRTRQTTRYSATDLAYYFRQSGGGRDIVTCGDTRLAQVPCCTDEVAGGAIWEGFGIFFSSQPSSCAHAGCNMRLTRGGAGDARGRRLTACSWALSDAEK